MRRLSAVDALGRGTANVRANLELLAVTTLGSIAIGALAILSVLPWLATLGADLGLLPGRTPDPQQVGEMLARVLSGGDLLARLGGLLLSFSLAMTLASVLYCWYQGGILGLLVAADAQAPQGPGREPILFRIWSMPLFLHEAQRLTWRLMWFVSLFLGIWLVVGAITVGLFAGAGLLGSSQGAGAGCALACGILLPLMFVGFVLLAAAELGQADLVRPESGVITATRNAFAILGRRLGAAAALLSIFFVVSFGLGIAFTTVGAVGGLVFGSSPVLDFTFRGVLLLLQLACGGLVNLVSAAAFVALVRSETTSAEPA